MTPVPVEEVRGVIKKCLENAALINYNKLASEAKVEGNILPTVIIMCIVIIIVTNLLDQCRKYCFITVLT